MQRLEVSGAVRPIYGSLGVKRLNYYPFQHKKQNIFISKIFNKHRIRQIFPHFRYYPIKNNIFFFYLFFATPLFLTAE